MTCLVYTSAVLFCQCTIFIILQASSGGDKLLLVLLDGLRYDLFNADMPNLKQIGIDGVKADMILPPFPTKSIPSMYTTATGLYTESHGAVNNNYYDPETGIILDYEHTCNASEWFDTGAEPIWVSANFSGLTSGTYMYPGGSVEIKGVRPNKDVANTEWRWYNLPFRKRIDDVVTWFRDDDLDLVLLYHGQLDTILHATGMESSETMDMISEIDDGLAYLLDELNEYNLLEDMNIIITSDHGHTTAGDVIRVWDCISENDVDFWIPFNGAVGYLNPKLERREEVYQQLKECHHEMNVYKKDETPDYLHYKYNERILDILLLANPPWNLVMSNTTNETSVTEHGYDFLHSEMQSIFYGYGPRFKVGYERGSFESVNIYPLMCELLGISPSPCNGSLDNVSDLLDVTPSSNPNVVCSIPLVLFLILVSLTNVNI
ncbi:ectonucleotide pyrophosphatase/phosphodiesterase family member 7-like [Saccoglossus kowalevskii]